MRTIVSVSGRGPKRRERRLTGASLPIVGGGISWTYEVSDREVIRRLVIDLEEKRALSAVYDAEFEGEVNPSVLAIRQLLTNALKDLSEESPASKDVDGLRRACNDYLTVAQDPIDTPFTHLRPHFRKALQTLRTGFRVGLVRLADGLELERARGFASTLPTETMEFPEPS